MGGLCNVTSNYPSLTAPVCRASWSWMAVRTYRWMDGWMDEVWPVQYKGLKQSGLRGRVLDLCWPQTPAESPGSVLFPCSAQVKGVDLTPGAAPPLRPALCRSALCLLPPRNPPERGTVLDVGQFSSFFRVFRLLVWVDVQSPIQRFSWDAKNLFLKCAEFS